MPESAAFILTYAVYVITSSFSTVYNNAYVA